MTCEGCYMTCGLILAFSSFPSRLRLCSKKVFISSSHELNVANFNNDLFVSGKNNDKKDKKREKEKKEEKDRDKDKEKDRKEGKNSMEPEG